MFSKSVQNEIAPSVMSFFHAVIAANPRMYQQHPLEEIWNFWYYRANPGKPYTENYLKVSTFCTVEDFWRLLSSIKPPSMLDLGSDYAFFKRDIRPVWEDPANSNGGCWVVRFHDRQFMDAYWHEFLLYLIGENFEHSKDLCGIVVSARNISRISIWTSNIENKEAILEIGQKLKDIAEYGPPISFSYIAHRDAMNRTSKSLKTIYTI